MSRGTVKDYLIRAVLDDAFRELAMRDPRRAVAEYDLSDEEREILCDRDERLLGLLGRVAADDGAGASEMRSPAANSDARAPAGSVKKMHGSGAENAAKPALPEVKLLLRLVPRAAQSPAAGSPVAYEASLHPWPRDRDSQPAETGSGGASAEGPEKGGTSAIEWMIRITPTVVNTRESSMNVSCAASIESLTAESETANSSPGDPSQVSGAALGAPWNHHVESRAAKAAAKAVRECAAGERYEKLLDLIRAMQSGDADG
jgi:hypothetical protein